MVKIIPTSWIDYKNHIMLPGDKNKNTLSCESNISFRYGLTRHSLDKLQEMSFENGCF